MKEPAKRKDSYETGSLFDLVGTESTGEEAMITPGDATAPELPEELPFGEDSGEPDLMMESDEYNFDEEKTEEKEISEFVETIYDETSVAEELPTQTPIKLTPGPSKPIKLTPIKLTPGPSKPIKLTPLNEGEGLRKIGTMSPDSDDGAASESSDAMPEKSEESPMASAPAFSAVYEASPYDEGDLSGEESSHREGPSSETDLEPEIRSVSVEPRREIVSEESRKRPPLIFSDANPHPTRSHSSAADMEQPEEKKPLRKKKLSASLFERISSDGEFFRTARESAELTVEDVCTLTRIRDRYIHAMERDDEKSFPLHVFHSAYRRTLAELYGVPQDVLERMTAQFHDVRTSAELSQELLRKLEDNGAVNSEESQRVRKVFMGAAIAGTIVFVLVTWAVVAIIGSVRNAGRSGIQSPDIVEPATPGPMFDEHAFDVLIAPQVPEATSLTLDENGRPVIRNN